MLVPEGRGAEWRSGTSRAERTLRQMPSGLVCDALSRERVSAPRPDDVARHDPKNLQEFTGESGAAFRMSLGGLDAGARLTSIA